MDAQEAIRLLHPGAAYPSPLQRRVDYAGTTEPVYIGWAARSVAETDARWYVEKLEYDSEGRWIKSTHSPIYSIWANRTGLTYA